MPGCSSEPPPETQTPKPSPPPKNLALSFNGGPMGGTFNYFANKMANIISDEVEWLNIITKISGGSFENLAELDESMTDMGIVYAGDAFLGRRGSLPGDPKRYDQTRALAYLYGAPAQLVVRKDLDIESVQDLKGMTIAIGNPGSGAALSAERFFRHLNLWHSIEPQTVGYSRAAGDFIAGKVDGFWVLVGYPNVSIIEAASRTEITIMDLHPAAVASDFYNLYPFYTEVVIPADTYAHQTEPVFTFQDSALWCARSDLSENAVYESLKAIFSDNGLKKLQRTHRAARSISLKTGIQHLPIPLHPGAVRFWSDHEIAIPPILLP
ncbi:C4-dicarboxylate ABC transporter substrate-binding protein [Pseudodesulfovibrio sp. S3]|nr:C4-dicarboxylate ABC transporter substrate-binding protein [Pseudodesulfovibrio sp. S3]